MVVVFPDVLSSYCRSELTWLSRVSCFRYIHCDPHPGNLLVRRADGGDVEIVLLDHGLYTVSSHTSTGEPSLFGSR